LGKDSGSKSVSGLKVQDRVIIQGQKQGQDLGLNVRPGFRV